MQIIVSERSFFNHLRQIENIGSEVTDEELSVRAEGYIRKLAAHVRNNFGVDILPRPEVNGTLATLTASLKPSWDEESVATRLEGLNWLVPVAVSLEWADVPAFCYEPIMRAAIQEQFGAFQSQLRRLTVGEIRPALENCARQIFAAPAPAPTNDYEVEVANLEYDAFLALSGKKDPGAKQREIDEFRRREEAAYTAQQQAAMDARWNPQD